MLEGVFGMPGMEQVRGGDHATSTSCAGSAGRRRSRRWRCSSCRADASFVTGQAIAVDGGYTAGRDHGVTDMFGI